MYSLYGHISAISHQAMTDICDRALYDFQREAITCLLMMMCKPYHPEVTLRVQGSSGGKLAFAQTVCYIDYGITIMIKETLTLAADQKSKVDKAQNTYGPVLAYQLDSMKTRLVQILQNKLNL